MLAIALDNLSVDLSVPDIVQQALLGILFCSFGPFPSPSNKEFNALAMEGGASLPTETHRHPACDGPRATSFGRPSVDPC